VLVCERTLVPTRIVAYHRTEELRDGTFIPQVQILSPSGGESIDTRLRDDDHPCATREDAEAREKRLVEAWRLENFPDLGVAFQN
jgi:hypothetical protein